MPKVDKELIQKYLTELEKAKNEYVYPGEKEKVCPLYPLVAFPKMNQTFAARESRLEGRRGSLLQPPALPKEPTPPQLEDDEQTEESEEETSLTSCITCHRVLQLYKLRYQALVFKPDKISGDLFALKGKLVTQWDMDDLRFLVGVYKYSKKEIDIKAEINKLTVRGTRRITSSEGLRKL